MKNIQIIIKDLDTNEDLVNEVRSLSQEDLDKLINQTYDIVGGRPNDR